MFTEIINFRTNDKISYELISILFLFLTAIPILRAF